MFGFLLGCGVARSRSRARARRSALPPGYAEFEFMVLIGAMAVGALWPIHLGFVLHRWGLHVAWASMIASVIGIIGLATGPGYLVVGFLYGVVWLSLLISRGVEAEERGTFREPDNTC